MSVLNNDASCILEMKGITKRFPGVLALDEVNFQAKRGEIHALLGQNGAGKSTLMKILAGDYSMTDGEIFIDGEAVSLRNQRQALNLNIAIVYQEISLLSNLTVAENIFLGREIVNGIAIDNQKIMQESEKVLDILGIDHISLDEKVSNLSLAQRQLVEIARAISYEPRILILDEPTATLTPEDVERMFRVLDRLKQQNIAIIYISHRLKEIMNHCDRGTILRNGRTVKTVEIKNTTEEEIIELMIGQKKENFFRAGNADHENAKVLLEVQNCIVGDRVRNVSFKLHRGEIIGLTGLLGAGQNELTRSLFGLAKDVKGKVLLNGREVTITSPLQALEMGICLLTENRKEEGLFLDMSVKENTTLPILRKFWISKEIPFISLNNEEAAAKDVSEKVNVVTRSMSAKIRTLSGGNQQKVILARWLLQEPEVFLFIEPTRGIDVGAKAEIYRHLDQLSKQGKGIIVVSPDLIEILGVADRVLVMREGELVKTFAAADATEEKILAATQGTSYNGEEKTA